MSKEELMTFDELRELLEVPENDDVEILYQEVLTALDAVEQTDFEQLPGEVQVWFNDAVTAITDGQAIPEFVGEESAVDDGDDGDDSGLNLVEMEAKSCKVNETYFIDMELEDGTIEATPVTCTKKSVKTITVQDGDGNEFKLDPDAVVYIDQEAEPEPEPEPEPEKKVIPKKLGSKLLKTKEEPKKEEPKKEEKTPEPEKKAKVSSTSKKAEAKGVTDEVCMHRSVSLTNMTKEQLIKCLKAIATTLEECEG